MCTAVYAANGRRLGCVKDLRDAGFDVEDDDHDGRDEQECLCGTDVGAIVARAGVSFERDELGDYFVDALPAR